MQVLRVNPDFRRLWMGDAISQAGSAVTALALPYVAVAVLHATPFQVGLVTTFQYAAFVLVGLPAGVWIDRTRCRRVLIASDLGRAVLIASVPAAALAGWLTLPQLYAVALSTGVLLVFATVAHQTYVPKIVEEERLETANSRLELSRGVAEASGPAATGYLIAWLTAPLAVGADAASFVLSALAVSRIRFREPEPAREHHISPGRSIRIGIRFVVRQPVLRVFALASAGYNFFDTFLATMFLVLLVRELAIASGTIGLVFALAGLGGLGGALLATRLTQMLGEGPTIVLARVAVSIGDSAIPLAQRGWLLWVAAVGNAVGTLAIVASVITQLSFRQRVCPPSLLGRVTATMRLIAWSTVPLGAFAGGVLGQTVGVRPTLWIGAGGVAAAGLPIYGSRLFSIRRLPVPVGDDVGPAPASMMPPTQHVAGCDPAASAATSPRPATVRPAATMAPLAPSHRRRRKSPKRASGTNTMPLDCLDHKSGHASWKRSP